MEWALFFLLAVQDPPKADLEKTRLFVYDASKGLTLRVRDDGKVELQVTEADRDGAKVSRRYSADSAEEFARKHADVVRRHGLDRYLPSASPLAQNEFEKWWEEFKKQRAPLPDFRDPFEDPDWDKWLKEQRERMEELRRLFRRPGLDPAPAPLPEPAPGGREFGIKVESVGETLRDQLSLAEGEGVMVTEVKPDSPAGKAGVRKHDIVLKVDGKPVADKWQFRRDVLAALSKPKFEVEIVRSGKRSTLTVQGGAEKDE
jgi:hypothetical protein